MRKSIASLFFLLLLLITSCGADRLNSSTAKSKSALSSASECSFTTDGPPVCGIDGKDYLNETHARCFTSVNWIGHCKCSTDLIVCGSDGDDHNECEAINNLSYSIVKFSPCASTPL